MKLINKLEKSNLTSIYSGQFTRNVEMSLRPVPKVVDGVELKSAQRYYVFRLLFFTGEHRTDFPAIVRNEHSFYQKDAAGNIKGVKRICCPTTMWARQRIQEPVDKDYCPICKYSYERNTAGWKDWKTTHVVDDVSLKLAKDTERQWAAYFPVLVVSDPLYKNNNNHLRVLRLAGDEGKAAYKKINDLIFEAQEKGLNIFNGESGVNIGILCEKCEKERTNRKTGEVVIDPETGAPRTYTATCITDVRLLTKHLREYTSFITESAIDNLHFDDTFGEVATREQLNAFLHENFLVNDVSDADFDDDEFSDKVEDDNDVVEVDEVKPAAKKTIVPPVVDEDDADEDDVEDDMEDDVPTPSQEDVEEEESEDETEDEFENESPRDAIARITKGRTVTAPKAAPAPTPVKKAVAAPAKAAPKTKLRNAVAVKPTTEKLRDDSLDIDPDDLPF